VPNQLPIESGKNEDWTLVKGGSLNFLKGFIRKNYTIKQNNPSNKKYIRLAVCKNPKCLAQVKIETQKKHGNEENECPSELFMKGEHTIGCKYTDFIMQEDPFSDPDLINLIDNLYLKPTEVIKEYLKIEGKKLQNDEKIRLKITNLRAKRKLKRNLHKLFSVLEICNLLQKSILQLKNTLFLKIQIRCLFAELKLMKKV